jgi:hypothetical protein
MPLSILRLFNSKYEGHRAVRLKTIEEASLMERLMTKYTLSYRSKINNTRKYGREFIYMLVEDHPWP